MFVTTVIRRCRRAPHFRSPLSVLSTIGDLNAKGISKHSLSTESNFQPPPLNTYHGEAVYENINLSSPTSMSLERNADEDAVFVVSGGSRGIGLQVVKDLLHRTKGTVIACSRNPESSPGLKDVQLSPHGEKLKMLTLDVTDQSQIESVANTITSDYSRVDGLFNVAGVLGDPVINAGPERSVTKLDREWLIHNIMVNTVGPMTLMAALVPLMSTKKGKKQLRPESVIVNLSARVASISDNTGGVAWHSYRISKAALNQGARTVSHELKRQGTLVISFYPGFTDTDLSKPFQKAVKKSAIFPVEFVSGRLLDVVNGAEEKHSGGLYDWAGQALPF